MSDFLLLVIFGVCWTWGIHCLFEEGYLLESVSTWGIHNLPAWAVKPLYACPPCMASVHGFAIAAVYYDFHLIYLVTYPIALCGANFIIKKFVYPDYE